MNKLQLEIPRIIQEKEYSFPYWSVQDRVIGQPIAHLGIKYEATYKRVADLMIRLGPKYFNTLNLLGLFATNYKTIGDYLSFQFHQHGLKGPKVENVAVVERDKEVCRKIIDKELSLVAPTNLFLAQTTLKNLLYQNRTRGRKPNQIHNIQAIQDKFSNQSHFLDFDLMCNWSCSSELQCLPNLINKFAADRAIIHINAISSFPRTPLLVRTKAEIKDILFKDILLKLRQQISNVTINSYITKTRVKTEMTSVVFAVNR